MMFGKTQICICLTYICNWKLSTLTLKIKNKNILKFINVYLYIYSKNNGFKAKNKPKYKVAV